MVCPAGFNTSEIELKYQPPATPSMPNCQAKGGRIFRYTST